MTIGDEHTDSDVVEWITRISEQAARDYPGSPRTIAYGPDEQNVVDMWGPNEAPTLVVSLHGGYFAAMYDRSINDALVRAMAARGVAVANVEYRRTGSANTATDSLEDARVAVDCVLSDRAVAPQRVVVVGHSAGGYLALTLVNHPEVDTVIALAPVTDLLRCHQEQLDDGAVSAWIGCRPEDDPIAWQTLTLDAGENDGDSARLVIIHGEDDTVVPLQHSRDWVAQHADSPSTVDLEVLRETGHFEFLDPGSHAARRVIEEVSTN